MTVQEVVGSDCAMQVMFYDGEGMCSGILLGDKIIRGCCGGVFEVEDVFENAKIDNIEVAIRVFTNWTNMSDEIKGDASNQFEDTVVLEKEN